VTRAGTPGWVTANRAVSVARLHPACLTGVAVRVGGRPTRSARVGTSESFRRAGHWRTFLCLERFSGGMVDRPTDASRPGASPTAEVTGA
jgi:hypothetical protein